MRELIEMFGMNIMPSIAPDAPQAHENINKNIGYTRETQKLIKNDLIPNGFPKNAFVH